MDAALRAALEDHQRMELESAEAGYRAMLEQQPGALDVATLLADICFESGRVEEARTLVRRALPDGDVDARLASRRAQWMEIAGARRALAGEPGDAQLWNTCGNALTALGHADAALECYGRALLHRPDYVAAHYNRGNAFLACGRHGDALACFDRVVELDPTDAEALVERGNTLFELARAEDALASYDRALAISPHSARALCNRGLCLRRLGRSAESMDSLLRAVALEPVNPLFLVLCADAQAALGRHAEALASIDRALAAFPRDAVALNNRGTVLMALQRPAEALDSFTRALAVEPATPGVLVNRGGVLRDLHRYGEALADLDRALCLSPDFREALANRGLLLRDMGRYEEAARDFARLLEVAPDHDYALGDKAHCRLYCCDWRDYDVDMAAVGAAVAAGRRAVMPFAFVAMPHEPRAELACARTFVEDRFPARATPLWTGERYAHDRIRVAYLSADYHDHATAYLMAELFELHDRNRFEVFAISYGPDARGAMRDRLRHAFEHFTDVRAVPDDDVAKQLRSAEIDIAVDLKGYTRDCRPGILAYRPAPVQVSYLGYPGTTGADYIDYIVADAHVLPEGEETCYAERVVRLPYSYQANDSRRAISSRAITRAEVGLPPAGFVFCCFNNLYKVTPGMFALWMRLLANVEGSVLWLLESYEPAMRNLRREAERHGVAASRLVSAPRMKIEDHLPRHRLADIFLDTLPCNAHTTASDALWSGLPVLTCRGSTFAGRVGASLLHAAGLPELVTGDLDAYYALAMRLATSPELLAGLRRRLAQNLASSPLYDAKAFTRYLEAAYIRMWERCQAGEDPAAVTISSREGPARTYPG